VPVTVLCGTVPVSVADGIDPGTALGGVFGNADSVVTKIKSVSDDVAPGTVSLAVGCAMASLRRNTHPVSVIGATARSRCGELSTDLSDVRVDWADTPGIDATAVRHATAIIRPIMKGFS